MSRKIRLPDEDVEPIWDKMDLAEREWYELFKKATEYHNWKALRTLCDLAPSDQYDRLQNEIAYEMDAFKRERYEVPKSRVPSYSEWDYSWAAPKRSSNKRQAIDTRYEIENTEPEFYSAPGKKVKFK